MKNIKYLTELVVGENWPVLLIGLLIMLFMAYKNCFYTRTGRVYYRRENGLFVFLSSVAGFFHFMDLMHAWIVDDLIIIEETACKNAANAKALSILVAALFGLAVGTLFYVFAQMTMLRRSEFMERRYFLSHMRTLRNYSSYNNYRNYSRF